MSRPLPRAFTLALAVTALASAGCGDDDSTTTSTAVETIERSPKLPPGWSDHINKSAGFSIGVPPGWSADSRGTRTELRSPEQLAAVSVTIDRTDEVLEVPLDQLATATISAGVPGLSEIEPSESKPLKHHYDAVELEASGVGGDENVPEDLRLVVMRRDAIATLTLLAAVNAKNHPRFYLDEIDEIINSVRTRPLTPAG